MIAVVITGSASIPLKDHIVRPTSHFQTRLLCSCSSFVFPIPFSIRPAEPNNHVEAEARHDPPRSPNRVLEVLLRSSTHSDEPRFHGGI
eukprot:Gb_35885 [translate_table: standard]